MGYSSRWPPSSPSDTSAHSPIFRTIGRISAALDVPPGEIAEFAAAIATRGGVANDADTGAHPQESH